MQMPAGQLQRGPTMNIYSGLLFLAVIALICACGFVAWAGRDIGPGGSPFGTHPYDQTRKSYDIKLGDGK